MKKTMRVTAITVTVFILDAVIAIWIIVNYRSEVVHRQEVALMRLNEERYRQSKVRSYHLWNCAVLACASVSSPPGNIDELRKWMTEKGSCRGKLLDDYFVDGFGSPFELQLTKTPEEGIDFVVRSAGQNKQYHDHDDRVWTYSIWSK